MSESKRWSARYFSPMLPVFMLFVLLLTVQPSLYALPENSYVRGMYIDRIMGPLETAEKLTADVLNEPGYGHQVQFFVHEGKDIVYFCFYHGRDIEFSKPVSGSVVLQRSRETGDLIRMKVFYKDEPKSYFTIEPKGTDQSVLTIFLMDYPMQEGVVLPFSVRKAAGMSVSGIMRSSAPYVDWDFYVPDQDFLHTALTSTDDLVDQVRAYLKQLNDADDGAIDESGRFVFIDDLSVQPDQSAAGLNCSGFAKWVVDGVLYPETKTLLPVDILKQPHPEYRGNRWSEKVDDVEDPYFGLDWTRNLAVQALKVRISPKAVDELNPESADVDYLKYHEYREDVGYSIERLPTVLYELARLNPDHFYLGSVNTLVHGGYELRRHLHVAVLFPWLDDKGALRVIVMERTDETSLDSLVSRYEGGFIHLVEVSHNGVFKPGDMRLEPTLKR